MREIDFSAFTGMDLYNIIRIVVRQIASICNSGFFLFSGYLFFFGTHEWNRSVYVKKLKTRINTLLIPYISWNIINVLVTPVVIFAGRIIKKDGDWGRFPAFLDGLLEKGIWNIFLHFNTWGNVTNILGWPRPSMGPYSVPMWFLQTLIVLTIATPIIYLICRYLKIYGIILLGILYYTGIWFSVPGFSIGAVFFFTLGAYFGINKMNMILELRRYALFWFIISLLTLAPSVYFNYDGITTYNYFSPVFILATVISAINITSYLIEAKKVRNNKTLSQATFFVYGMHTVLVLGTVGYIFDWVIRPRLPAILIIRYFTVPVITAYVCVGIYYILKKIMPGILRLLSGSR